VASGRFSEGVQALRELAGGLSIETAWEIEMQKRAQHLADIAESNPIAACRLLADWELETASALRIQDVL